MLHPFHVEAAEAGLLTDLYQLTMAASYWAHERNEPAVFELYFRRLPRNRSFVLAAGLEQALSFITTLRFSKENLSWMRNLPVFRSVDPGFFAYLEDFRFRGEVWAVPEGTPVFPGEPLLQVRGSLIEAQILETHLLCLLNLECLVATKATRMVHAANGRAVIDFGARRAHGPQAALLAARAAWIGGCSGTSNVLAGKLGDIPLYGTSAHSFIMAFSSELEAFEAYRRIFPDHTVLLIDTYDTMEAAKKVQLVRGKVNGVRIDSGNLLEDSRRVREILDNAGLRDVKIFASGDLNEYKIEDLIAGGAPIDMFGVGTELVTSYDDPALSAVYKMVEVTRKGVVHGTRKTSAGKATVPLKKQVYRFEKNGMYVFDLVAGFEEDPPPGAMPLLQRYVRDGVLVGPLPPLPDIQKTAAKQIARLPLDLRQIRETAPYPVRFSKELQMEGGSTTELS